MPFESARPTVKESRRLTFDMWALMDAVLTFDREHNGWLWKCADHQISIDDQGRVTVMARRVIGDETECVERSAAWVASALLHYCWKKKIPVPRRATKWLQVKGSQVELIIDLDLNLIPIVAVRTPHVARPETSTSP